MTLELPIPQLRIFLLVAEHGSYQLAAEKAFRSQPAVSKSIQALEGRLGQRLFEPGQRTTLTPFGATCLQLAQEMVQYHDRATGSMLALAHKQAGSLVVASIGSVATSWLPQLIERFAAEHAAVSIRLIDDNSENIERMVLARELDFGLCSVVSSDARLAFTPLARDAFGLVCNKRHPLAARRSMRWSELAGLPLIATTVHRQLDDVPEAAPLRASKLHVSSYLTLLSMLERGVGVTVMSAMAVPSMATQLAFIALTAPRRQRQIGILRVKGRSLSPAAAAMEQLLLEQAAMVQKTPGGAASGESGEVAGRIVARARRGR